VPSTIDPNFAGRTVLEIFAGSAELSQGCRRHGLSSLAFDILNGASGDISRRSVLQSIYSLIRRGKVLILWFAFPCSTFSRARRFKRDGPGPLREPGENIYGMPDLNDVDRQKASAANKLALIMCNLLRFAVHRGVPCVVENPMTSMLWSFPELCSVISRFGSTQTRVDFCQFGKPWRKATYLHAFLLPQISAVGKQCHMHNGRCSATNRPHFVLEGKDEHNMFWTKRAEPYPRPLCNALAQCFKTISCALPVH
jgi:hypothetical protein